MRARKITFFLFFAFVFLSCSDELDDEGIPAYISIDDISFENANPAIYGSAGENITDAWVYADGDFIGVFELPCTVPILQKGTTEIQVGAGIKVNGIGATRAIYPFYSLWAETVELIEDSVISLNPKVDYNPDFANIAWKEEFEDSSTGIDTIFTSDVALERINLDNPDPTFQSFVARAEISETNPGLKAITNQTYPLPKGGAPIYLELDYSCNQEVVLSLIIDPEDTPQREEVLIFLNATASGEATNWRHIYVDLTDPVNFSIDAQRFGIGITAIYSPVNPTGIFQFDNLKLIHQ